MDPPSARGPWPSIAWCTAPRRARSPHAIVVVGRNRTQRVVSGEGFGAAADPELLFRRHRDCPGARYPGEPDAVVRQRRCLRPRFGSAQEGGPLVNRRTLAIVVNARKRCGLDPMLVGNIITTLNIDLLAYEAAGSIAEHIRHMHLFGAPSVRFVNAVELQYRTHARTAIESNPHSDRLIGAHRAGDAVTQYCNVVRST